MVNGLFTWTASTVNITGSITLLGGAVVSDADTRGGDLGGPTPVTSTDNSGITVTGGGSVNPTPPQGDACRRRFPFISTAARSMGRVC